MGQSQGQTIRNTIIFDSMNNDNDNDNHNDSDNDHNNNNINTNSDDGDGCYGCCGCCSDEYEKSRVIRCKLYSPLPSFPSLSALSNLSNLSNLSSVRTMSVDDGDSGPRVINLLALQHISNYFYGLTKATFLGHSLVSCNFDVREKQRCFSGCLDYGEPALEIRKVYLYHVKSDLSIRECGQIRGRRLNECEVGIGWQSYEFIKRMMKQQKEKQTIKK
jgi:hypothetical protein